MKSSIEQPKHTPGTSGDNSDALDTLLAQHRDTLLVQILGDALETESGEIPTDEQVLRFADGTARGREKRAMQARIRESRAVALLVAPFIKEYAVVRELATADSGWRGASAHSVGLVPVREMTRWEEHLARCPRTRWKVSVAQRCRRYRSYLVPATFALGSLAPLCLLIIFSLVRTSFTKPVGVNSERQGPSTSIPGTVGVAKGDDTPRTIADIHSRVDEPDLSQPDILIETIQRLEAELQERPNDPRLHLTLARCYAAQSILEKANRILLQKQAKGEYVKAQQLLNLERSNYEGQHP